ncbi:hypothetical protein SAMN04515618_11799 [Collimonas sp. OK307]|nr:hypothetical protein SAMN04515618_11799 [Collimonas sp. OK307]
MEAREYLEEWMKTNGEELLQKETIKAIEPHLNKALQEIRDKSTATLVQLDAHLQKTAQLNQSLEALSASKINLQEPDEASVTEVELAPASEAAAEKTGTPIVASPPMVRSNGSKPSKIRDAVSLRGERPAEAIVKLEEIIESMQGSESPEDIVLIIDAETELALTFDGLDNIDKAAEFYDRAVREYADTNTKKVAIAISRAASLATQFFERIADYERVISITEVYLPLFTRLELTGLSAVRAIRCLNVKSRCLFNLSNYEGVLATHTQFEQIFPDRDGAATFTSVATTLDLSKARALEFLSRTAEAKSYLLELLSKSSNKVGVRPSRQMKHRVVRLEFALARLYENEKNFPQALAYYGNVIENQLEAESGISLKLQAMLHKATILSELQLRNEELTTYDAIVDLWEKSGSSDVYAVFAAAALVNKAIVLSRLERTDEASAVTNRVLNLFSTNTEPEVIEQTAKAVRLKSLLER